MSKSSVSNTSSTEPSNRQPKTPGPQPSRSRLVARVEATLGSIAMAAARVPLATLLVVAVVTLASLAQARHLKLSADLVELLPKTFESVQNFERAKQTFGGFGYVAVLARADNPETLTRFADDVAPKLEALPSVRYVMSQRARPFFEQYGLYYMQVDDLNTLYQRIKRRAKWEKRKQNPLYIDLEDGSESPPQVQVDDLVAKYSQLGADNFSGSGSNYYLADDGRSLALFVKPGGISFDLNFSKQVVQDVKRVVDQVDLSAYPGLTIAFGGAFTKRVDTQQLITRDLKIATGLALVLVFLYLVSHFRRIWAVFALLIPLGCSLIWTYAASVFAFDTLNILTGLIGSVLVGVGIDQGIHLLERFRAEYAAHGDTMKALRATYGVTGRAVAVASLTTMIAFSCLTLSELRAFREFGAIAAVGMSLQVVAYLVVLPAILSLAMSRGWRLPGEHRSWQQQLLAPFAKHPLVWATLSAVFVALTYVSYTTYVSMGYQVFNYNNRDLAQTSLLSFRLDDELDALHGYSMTPVIVFADTPEQERAIASILRDRQRQPNTLIDVVMTRSDLVPTEQPRKQAILGKIARTIRPIKAEQLPESERELFTNLKQASAAQPFAYSDLPPQLTRQFEALPQQDGSASEERFVFASANISLSDGLNAIAFANEVRGIELADGQTVSATGESMIMADVYSMVRRESPRVMAATLVLVFLSMLVLLGSLWQALAAMLPAVVTVVGAVCLLPVVGLQLNTLNIIIIPVLLGVGVDGGVHMVAQFATGLGLQQVLTQVGPAIMGALMTTGLGFGSLLIADHAGLNSVGWVAIVGLGVNLFACLVLLPSWITVGRKLYFRFLQGQIHD